MDQEVQAVLETIKQQIDANPIILYMKGTPSHPQCGFSDQAVRHLEACGAAFAFVDIIANPEIRKTLPLHANWPTFPQLYVRGELIGGADIIADMYASGELATILKDAV